MSRPRPTDRIVWSHEAHIDSLVARIEFLESHADRLLNETTRIRNEFEGRLDRLREEQVRLLPENARLTESLRNAIASGTLAFVLITVGGVAMGYAGYVALIPSMAPAVASDGSEIGRRLELVIATAGAAGTLAGVLLLLVSSIRGWRSGKDVRERPRVGLDSQTEGGGWSG